MKLLKIAFAVTMAAVPLLSGCVSENEITDQTLNNNSSLFVGEWKLTRQSISPAPPVPDIIVGMFLNSSPTWKITGNPDTGQASRISYDGRDTWFKIPRLGISDLSVDVKPPRLAEQSGSLMTATGGGTINVGRISIIALPEFTNVSVNYQDSIEMTIGTIDAANNIINATITLRVQATGGSYTMDGVAKPITPYSATVTYTAVRPRRR